MRLGYFLSQDDYGATIQLSKGDHTFPVPDLAVGRLVGTAADATSMLDAYLQTKGGVVNEPKTALVTGYDFFADTARDIQSELATGLGKSDESVDSLISPPRPKWTADDLRSKLLSDRHDIIFLGAHFSAVSALAADYETRMLASELADSSVDLRNSIIFSLGCSFRLQHRGG